MTKNTLNIPYHEHNGVDVPRLKKSNTDLVTFGFFQTVGSVPTATPTTFLEQIQLYNNAGAWELYVYDTNGSAWRKFNYYTP